MSQIDEIRQEQEAQYKAPSSPVRKMVQTLSNLFHPLLTLTFAALVICYFTPFQVIPQRIKTFFIGEVLLFTLVLPALIITMLHVFHVIGHWALRDRRDRMLPFFTNFTCYAVCAHVLTSQQIFPDWVLVGYYGSAILTFVAWIISFWWKISAHASANAAGATYFLMLFFYFPDIMPLWICLFSIIVVGGICSTRVYLGRHTLGQITAGVGLGILSMLLANFFFL